MPAKYPKEFRDDVVRVEPVNLFVYGVVGRDYPKYVCCFGRDV